MLKPLEQFSLTGGLGCSFLSLQKSVFPFWVSDSIQGLIVRQIYVVNWSKT